jgi:lysophospholipase L1-like esterase
MKILCLGDSYTIGEGVLYTDNFPHQLAGLLHRKNSNVAELTIVARTGWTTDELIGPMETQVAKNDYDVVTVLIGVNNQYRGRSATEFEVHFNYILNRAIHFAQGNAQHVICISIPDWGQTPFNTERNKTEVGLQIDAYNNIVQKLATQHNAHYVYITDSTRHNAIALEFLAEDKLHPSKSEYAIWAEKCVKIITDCH